MKKTTDTQNTIKAIETIFKNFEHKTDFYSDIDTKMFDSFLNTCNIDVKFSIGSMENYYVTLDAVYNNGRVEIATFGIYQSEETLKYCIELMQQFINYEIERRQQTY